MNPDNGSKSELARFFGVVAQGQSYLNILYLLLSFPLGIFYFVFLVTGLSLGLGLLIIWVGLMILVLMIGAWWALAMFERQFTQVFLRTDIPPMSRQVEREQTLWEQFKTHIGNPVTWKSLLYLFVKFPFGILSFVVVVTLVSLTLALIFAPLIYQINVTLWDAQVPVINLGFWQVDTMGEALACTVIGVGIGVISLHIMNGLAYVWGLFARLMLGTAVVNR